MPAKMVRIVNNDFSGISGGGVLKIILTRAAGVRRNPVRWTGQNRGVAARCLDGHSHWVLARLSRLILLHIVDHVVLPLGRIGAGFVASLIEHVVEIVDGVDDFADVSLLQFQYALAEGTILKSVVSEAGAHVSCPAIVRGAQPLDVLPSRCR